MEVKQCDAGLLQLPVRRRLSVLCIGFLTGVYLAVYAAAPLVPSLFLCALLICLGFVRRRQHRSALFYMLILAVLLGNMRCASVLNKKDFPTQSKVQISGTVTAIDADNRVFLNAVCIESRETQLNRPVLVSLMEEESDPRGQVQVGQRISGTGKLFAQREKRNPGGVNERLRALWRGYDLSGYLLPGWAADGDAVFSLREWFRQLRLSLLARMEAVFGERAPLYQAILLGERSGMDNEVKVAMQLTGTVHLLTVSGMHLSMIAQGLSWLLKKTGLSRRTRFALQTTALSGYAILTGGAPGTVRALLMMTIHGFAHVRGKRYDPLTALSAAALVMAAVSPACALGSSFQFSFSVVLGIHLLRNGVYEWLTKHFAAARRFPRAAAGLGLCVCAQTASVPMQLMLYGYVPMLALPMNLLYACLMPALMLGAGCCVLVSCFFPEGGSLLGMGLDSIGNGLQMLSLSLSKLPFSVLRLPAPHAMMPVFVLLFFALQSKGIRLGKKRRCAAWLCAAFLVTGYAWRLRPTVSYVQLDVGQGDGAVLRRDRHASLLDVGPAGSYDVLRYIRHEGLFVDQVILSHLDEDHAGALLTLLSSEVKVGQIVLAERAEEACESETALQALSLAAENGVPIRTVSAGSSIPIGGSDFAVLSPNEGLSGSNERSLVLYGKIEETTFLLTGDLPQKSEMSVIPNCDVLKVAHHGSKNATSDAWIRASSPKFALISVGQGNSYGHPAARVLESLEQAGAEILRTDQDGCVTLRLSKGNIGVQTGKKRREAGKTAVEGE